MINGYILVKPQIIEERCLEYVSTKTSLEECEVIAVSDPVKYLHCEDDNIPVHPGDRLILRDSYRITLEDSMFTEFGEGIYYVIQRREIAYIH